MSIIIVPASIMLLVSTAADRTTCSQGPSPHGSRCWPGRVHLQYLIKVWESKREYAFVSYKVNSWAVSNRTIYMSKLGTSSHVQRGLQGPWHRVTLSLTSFKPVTICYWDYGTWMSTSSSCCHRARSWDQVLQLSRTNDFYNFYSPLRCVTHSNW